MAAGITSSAETACRMAPSITRPCPSATSDNPIERAVVVAGPGGHRRHREAITHDQAGCERQGREQRVVFQERLPFVG
jgi:hypothetical protein